MTQSNKNGCDWYTDDLRARVEQTFQSAVQLSQLKSVLTQIKDEAKILQALFFSDSEQQELETIASDFDAKMLRTKQSILKNLEAYRQSGWKEIFDKGENG